MDSNPPSLPPPSRLSGIAMVPPFCGDDVMVHAAGIGGGRQRLEGGRAGADHQRLTGADKTDMAPSLSTLVDTRTSLLSSWTS
jgi:hypothetical protein